MTLLIYKYFGIIICYFDYSKVYILALIMSRFMSDYNILWRRYGLKDSPYFVNPLSSTSNLPLTLFTGRQEEKRQLTNIIRLGEGRCMVVGAPGVGKTTLVNFVRHEAAVALGVIGSQDARDILNKALNDKSEEVRESAVIALSNLDFVSQNDKTSRFAKMTGG